jgi:hypothetical protein
MTQRRDVEFFGTSSESANSMFSGTRSIRNHLVFKPQMQVARDKINVFWNVESWCSRVLQNSTMDAIPIAKLPGARRASRRRLLDRHANGEIAPRALERINF